MAFARAIGEVGSVTLVSGNRPFHTEVASIWILNQSSSGNATGAAAVAVLLLAISFVLLLAIGGVRWLATRHERA
jgi:sulfate transport system permease protein